MRSTAAWSCRLKKSKKLDRCISAWRNEVILSLRKLYRRLKSGDSLSPSTDDLYRRIKADELLTEQIEISALAQQFEQMSGNTAATPSGLAVIERVARYFAEASRQEVTSSTIRFKWPARFFIARRPSDQLPVRTPRVSAEFDAAQRRVLFCGKQVPALRPTALMVGRNQWPYGLILQHHLEGPNLIDYRTST
jgi:hypothetical protein